MRDATRLTPHELRVVARLVCFTAASVALHAVTLGAYIAGGGTASASAIGPAVLHAVLAPGHAAFSPSPDTPTAERATHSGTVRPGEAAYAPVEPSPAIANAEPRSGTPGALDIPMPDKWYPASELDVRAEPRSAPPLHYPQALALSGLSAKVKIVLFIDERGIVRKVELAERGIEQAFDVAAAKAWDDVPFSPAMKNGVAVKSRKVLELDFTSDLTPLR